MLQCMCAGQSGMVLQRFYRRNGSRCMLPDSSCAQFTHKHSGGTHSTCTCRHPATAIEAYPLTCPKWADNPLTAHEHVQTLERCAGHYTPMHTQGTRCIGSGRAIVCALLTARVCTVILTQAQATHTHIRTRTHRHLRTHKCLDRANITCAPCAW